MEVSRLDFGVRVEGVFVEEHRANSVVGHVESIRENITVNIFNRFLQCDGVPLACDLLLISTFSSTSRSWVPVVDAESFLYKRTIRHLLAEASLRIDHMSIKGNIVVCLHPRSESVCAWRRLYPRSLTGSHHLKTATSSVHEK